MCDHKLEYLMGVAGGVICRKCGMRFDHIPKQNEAPKAEGKVVSKAKIEDAPIEEVPNVAPAKKAPAKKPAAKKGAK